MIAANKVAIVTGAGSGIGKAVAMGLVGAGYRVVFAGRRLAPLQEAVIESGAELGRAVAADADVCSSPSVRALFDRTMATFGRLDLLLTTLASAPPKCLSRTSASTNGRQWWTPT